MNYAQRLDRLLAALVDLPVQAIELGEKIVWGGICLQCLDARVGDRPAPDLGG
jgi:hypothetical protein